MKLEKPQLHSSGDLKERVETLERYLYRLVFDLEGIIGELEEKNGKDL